MKCEFCNNSVFRGCVTCDAALCKYHHARGRNGQCADCYREQCACEDCGQATSAGMLLCFPCNQKPQFQTEAEAEPMCIGCNVCSGPTCKCTNCDRDVCSKCSTACSDWCHVRYCPSCAEKLLIECDECDPRSWLCDPRSFCHQCYYGNHRYEHMPFTVYIDSDSDWYTGDYYDDYDDDDDDDLDRADVTAFYVQALQAIAEYIHDARTK